MAVAIAASLVASQSPAPVQIVLNGVPAGQAYAVTGSALGTSWTVPGGSGVSLGSQVVLVDNRSAINAPIVYSVTTGGATVSASPLTVALPGARVVLQSLDGRESVRCVWVPNGLPMEPVPHVHTSDVPGRTRPPARIAPGGDGDLRVVIRTSREDSDALRRILRAGRPVVIRTDGSLLDLPAVELAVVTAAPSAASWDVVGMPADRTWSLSLLLVDDPEPSRVLGVFTWADFDAAMAGRTWADFDAIFAGRTWDAFDTQDWGALL